LKVILATKKAIRGPDVTPTPAKSRSDPVTHTRTCAHRQAEPGIKVTRRIGI
jgi:hypothetical protein